jgi:hypothetical protein
LINLQRTAGNRAVTLAVQREGGEGAILPSQSIGDVTARHAAIAAVASRASEAVWQKSFNSKTEYGGAIWAKGDRYGFTNRPSGEEASVNIGQNDTNCGCPEGTMPVGYWHTHPHGTEVLSGNVRERREGREAFSDGDANVAKDFQLDPFVRDMYGAHEMAAKEWFDGMTFPSWRPMKHGPAAP